MTTVDAKATNADDLTAAARQRVVPLIHRILEERARATRMTLVFDLFCRQLCDLGLAVDRATLSIGQLHPQLAARTILWEREAGGAVEVGRQHGVLDTAGYQLSPIRRIHEGSPPIRRRLALPDCPHDFPVLDDLAAQDYTDYYLMPLRFSTGLIQTMGFASKAPDGFSDLDIATIHAALPAFAAVVELRHVLATARGLLETYVGPNTGARILDGAIKRGDGTTIHAVVWLCDLRDFTALSERLPYADMLDLLNAYFDCMSAPVQARGGEILKFIGDAMLAIFPCEATGDALTQAADQAIAAAEDAVTALAEINRERANSGAPLLRCGIALHVGEVMYGNIGSANRLDYTVIGPTVNLVSRLEPLTAVHDVPIVVSADIAAASRRAVRSLGRHDLKGIAGKREAFTLKKGDSPLF